MLKNKSYQEAADDVYADLISDLSIIYDEMMDEKSLEECDGLDVAITLIKEKRAELYG